MSGMRADFPMPAIVRSGSIMRVRSPRPTAEPIKMLPVPPGSADAALAREALDELQRRVFAGICPADWRDLQRAAKL
jgi:hypothetical protein